MRKLLLIFFAFHISISNSYPDLNQRYPSNPQAVFKAIQNAKSKKEFLSFVTNVTRRNCIKDVKFDSIKTLYSKDQKICLIKSLYEYDLKGLSYPNLDKILKKSVVLELSKIENNNSIFTYAVFVREDNLWKYDFFISVSLFMHDFSEESILFLVETFREPPVI
ncbi:MAG: hypothetical protein Q8Q33_08255 [Chlamydiota bacterium]|nr:hypothetical protein [Chlamydiota bacterium]